MLCWSVVLIFLLCCPLFFFQAVLRRIFNYVSSNIVEIKFRGRIINIMVRFAATVRNPSPANLLTITGEALTCVFVDRFTHDLHWRCSCHTCVSEWQDVQPVSWLDLSPCLHSTFIKYYHVCAMLFVAEDLKKEEHLDNEFLWNLFMISSVRIDFSYPCCSA